MRDEVGAIALRRLIRERDQAVVLAKGAASTIAQRESQMGDLVRYLAVCVRILVRASEARRLATPEAERNPEPITGIRLPFDSLKAEGEKVNLYFRRVEELDCVFIRFDPFPGQAPVDPAAPPDNGKKIILLGEM